MDNNFNYLVRKAKLLSNPSPEIKVGDHVIYNNCRPANVVGIHTDSDYPYYTIQFSDGKERQTVSHKLTFALQHD